MFTFSQDAADFLNTLQISDENYLNILKSQYRPALVHFRAFLGDVRIF